MTKASADVIARGLAAWSRGDLDALESIRDPAVTPRAMQPGPWYFDNPEQVIRLLWQHETDEARTTRAEARCAESTTAPTTFPQRIRARR